jgi:hypothetical protein
MSHDTYRDQDRDHNRDEVRDDTRDDIRDDIRDVDGDGVRDDVRDADGDGVRDDIAARSPQAEENVADAERELAERHDPADTDKDAFVEPDRQPVAEDGTVRDTDGTQTRDEMEALLPDQERTTDPDLPAGSYPDGQPAQYTEDGQQVRYTDPDMRTDDDHVVATAPVAEESRADAETEPPVYNADATPVDLPVEQPVEQHVDPRVDGVPGDGTVLDDYADDGVGATGTGLWPAGAVDDLRSRWDAVQIRFVDDPSGVAGDARALVGEAIGALRQALDRLEGQLGEPVTGDEENDTERLRQRVADYRTTLDSLLSR